VSRLLLTDPASDASPPLGGLAAAPCASSGAAAFSDRADRYLARLDGHLAKLPADRARRTVELELRKWEIRYAAWIASNGATEYCAPGAEPVQATDFLLTIAGLGERSKQENRNR
jgi:hypothetical protein